MSEFIDRVAAAIYEAQGIVFAGTDPGPFETWPDDDKECYRVLAVAAIRAMREPTEEMLEAAYYAAMAEKANDVWQEMIDSVIPTPGQGSG